MGRFLLLWLFGIPLPILVIICPRRLSLKAEGRAAAGVIVS
jgi:hypothetical protein